jgi:hypothetical protein
MKIVKFILFPVIGCVIGFLYYRLVGCSTGTCPITSNPVISTVYGGVIGLLISLSIK